MKCTVATPCTFPFRSAMDVGAERTTDRLHVSTIVTAIGVATGQMEKFDDSPAGRTLWDPDCTTEPGFLWEHVFTEAVGERAGMRVGELERDGIVGSPDGLCILECPDRPSESIIEVVDTKCTWKSRPKLESELLAGGGPKSWYYIHQMMTYCAIVGATRGRLEVLYLVGDYKQGTHLPAPKCATYLLVWEAWEIEEWFTDVKNFAARMEQPT